MSKDQFNKLFGKRLKQALIEKDIKQRDLAKELNISPKQISSYVNGYALPTPYGLRQIAEQLNISSDFFLGLINEPTAIKRDDTDPLLSEEILMMRRSYAQMPEETRRALQELVNTIIKNPG